MLGYCLDVSNAASSIKALIRGLCIATCFQCVSAVALAKEGDFKISAEMQAAAKEAAEGMKVDAQTQQQVRDLMQHIRSDEYQNRIRQHQTNLKAQLGLSPETRLGNAGQGETPEQVENTPVTGARAYLFISSSMPLPQLRRYVRDALKVKNITLVLRGFKGGGKHIKPTLRFIADVLKEDPSCDGPQCPLRAVAVEIDPVRFNQYGISRVPALVFEPNEQFYGYCDSKTDKADRKGRPDRLIVYGDASLRYALEQLYAVQAEPKLQQMISALEPIPWENK